MPAIRFIPSARSKMANGGCAGRCAATRPGIGTSFQVTDTVNDLVHASGTPVMVRHLMRSEMLEGVNQVGLFFVPKS